MPTSWHKAQAFAPAWDLRETYAAAWDKFSDEIIDVSVGPSEVEEYKQQFEYVISTIPAWSICEQNKEHYFRSENIIVKKGIQFDAEGGVENWIIYNGTWKDPWYRLSSIFGHTCAEARADRELHQWFLQDKGWESGFKVVGTNCNCHPEVLKMGRMGRWERGVLTHHAFSGTIDAIAEQFGLVKEMS